MSFVRCYDAVEIVLWEAEQRFSQTWKLNNSAVARLREDCRDIDAVVRDTGALDMEAEIDEETLALSVSVTCDDMTLEYGRQHPFFRVIQHAESFSFHNTGEDSITVTFRFSGLFSKAE